MVEDDETPSHSAERVQPPVCSFNLPLPAAVPSSELVARGAKFFFFFKSSASHRHRPDSDSSSMVRIRLQTFSTPWGTG